MEVQTTIDDFIPEDKSNLNPRQWMHYNFVNQCSEMDIKFDCKEDELIAYEDWINMHVPSGDIHNYTYKYHENKKKFFEKNGYHQAYGNCYAGRKWREDQRILQLDTTRIQKVIGSNGIPKSTKEAVEMLKKMKIEALRKWEVYWAQVRKFEKHNQIRFVHGKERDTIEAIIEMNKKDGKEE